MAVFWFLVSVVLFIMLSSRPKNDGLENDPYAQGYWNGYRAFGDKVDQLIQSKRANATTLMKLINEGRAGTIVDDAATAAVHPVNTAESQFLADSENLHDETDYVDNYIIDEAAPVTHSIEMTAEQKAKRSLRNLNIILYTASFLLVAAGALFVASSSSPQTKLVTVISIITLFYVGGFIIHAKSVRLRPAALAFLGTGLALIPFAGLALQQYTNLGATLSWFITSAVGLIAYFIVAIRLQSQLVAYLTMAFVLSLVGSMTTAAAHALVWQFVAMILVSLSANVVAHFKPNWLPRIFSQPIERSGQIVTPVALVASLFVFDKLLLVDYEIVFAIATLHYVVAWLQTRSVVYETTIRVLSYVVFALVAWDIFNGNMPQVAFTIFLLMTLQHAFSLVMINQPGRAASERTWITVLFIVQTVLIFVWTNYYLSPLFTTIALYVMGLTSLAVAFRLRTVWVSLIGLIASMILPFVIARQLVDPSLPWWALTAIFMAAAIVAVYLYARWRHRSAALRSFMTIAYITYLALAIIGAWIEGSALVAMVTYFAAAIIVLVASYLARNPRSQVAFPAIAFLGVVASSSVLNIVQPWHMLFIGGVSAVMFWVMVCMHGYLRQSARQAIMLGAGQMALLVTAGVVFSADQSANTLVAVILLVASLASLALRWAYMLRAPVLSQMFAYSYVIYFVAALLITVLISSGWIATATGVGVMLFLLASYVERQPWIQVVASVLTVATLAIVASIIALPQQWVALFTFGIAAALFYVATGLHFAYKQHDRQLVMASTSQATLFLIIFAGTTGHYGAILTSFIILLVWAVTSLAIRWWCRDRSL
ncbi:MAG: hypothetical protein JWM07_318, partial [Candidatus Saccharibacteria bacterium]|nr:hypothetical protein [Candidatus Saccharibacteria bacterium]